MANSNDVCTACFPDGSRPQCRVFEHSSGALTIYSGLHATGKLPAMCQQADQRYRVCHLPEMPLNSPRPLAARAA
ncbi:MAG TPA: hypothetical protein VFY24_09890 [Azospira sp.]|nr:hypothetical protein [Azospira sp.]